MTRMKLKFVFAATSDLTKAIDFFEKDKAQVHNTYEKLEQILVNQMRKCLEESELDNLDFEDNTASKSARELVNLDVDSADTLGPKYIFIGDEVEKEIKKIYLNPKSAQLK